MLPTIKFWSDIGLRHKINMESYYTRAFATCLEIIIAIFGLTIFKKAGNVFRLLILLMMFGALTDIFSWLIYRKHLSAAYLAVDIYSLVESLLLIIIIQKSRLIKLNRYVFNSLLALLILTYITCYLIIPYLDSINFSYRGIYSFAYLGMVAALSAWSKLKWIEKPGNNALSPEFLMLTGIFIYSFCSIFIDSFIGNSMVNNVWWIHDVSNAIAYLLYGYSFVLIKRQPKEKRLFNLPEKVW